MVSGECLFSFEGQFCLHLRGAINAYSYEEDTSNIPDVNRSLRQCRGGYNCKGLYYNLNELHLGFLIICRTVLQKPSEFKVDISPISKN